VPQQPNKQKETITVTVKDRRDILFAGAAASVSSKNKSGPFDVLLQHANFVTLVFDYIYIDRGLPSEKKFDVKNGVLTVLNNTVNVYVGV
jgi:F0F1-type ATP synthase epsilon subunit